MHTLRPRTLLAVSALALLTACRDRSESLVGPPGEDASFIETLALKRGAALDVNESGVAAGWVEGDRAFRWTHGGQLQVLGTLGGDYSRGAFINAAGQVTGVSTTSDGARHVFLWTAGQRMASLGTLGGSELVVTAFSDSGHVVGWGTKAGGGTTGFIARAGTPLQLIPGYPLDVNNAGVVVGRTGPGASTAFRWTAGGGVQSLPAPWGSGQWQAPQLNEAGVIAGLVTSGGTRAVVRWSPSEGYTVLDDCALGCTPDVLSLNEPGAVAWTSRGGVAVAEPDGTVRRAAVVVDPSQVVLSDAGDVAGTGTTLSPAPATSRSFLWRASGEVAYYGRASRVYAINTRGDVVGSGAMQSGKDVGRPWNERPTWFDAAENHPPVASTGSVYEVLAGEPITLDARPHAADPDGDALRYYWDGFQDPLCCWRRRPPVGHGPTATYRWITPGEYTVPLSVSDLDSLFAHTTVRVRVLPNPEPPTRYGPYTGLPDGYILFDGRREDDPTGSRYRYYWSFDYKYAPRAVVSTKSFGVGTGPVELVVRDSTGALVEHVYTQVVVTPRATVFGIPRYLEDRTQFYIGLAYLPANQPAQEVSFDCGTGSFTAWAPAQGNAYVLCAGLLEGTYELRARHRLSPTAPVTPYSRSITVYNHQPGPVYVSPPGFGRVGAAVSASVSFTDTRGDGPWLVYVNWGDGTVTQTTTNSMYATLIHTYTAAGTYNVHAFVRDRDGVGGQSSTKSIRIFP